MNHDIKIAEIADGALKSRYARDILERLPDWFGNKEAADANAEGVAPLPFWAALDVSGRCVGFIAVKIHYGHTGDIYVCGVLPEHHRKGIGKALYAAAEAYLVRSGCKYVIVKTLSDIDSYIPYAQTRAFYIGAGFAPLITLAEMWDEDNPCLIMLKILPQTR